MTVLLTVIGNLTRDPEARTLPQGDRRVVNGGIASNGPRARDGEAEEPTKFYDFSIFGPSGEAFAKFHKKGQRAMLFGKLRMRTWTDQSGQQRVSETIEVSHWEFAQSRDSASTPASQPVEQRNASDTSQWDGL